MTEPADQTAPSTAEAREHAAVFTRLMEELAVEEAPRLFALVEEYGQGDGARVAGYGLAYAGHAEFDSVEGDFPLKSQSPESARLLFQLSSRSAGVERVHVVWMDAAEVAARAS